jgi:hypothetical protein
MAITLEQTIAIRVERYQFLSRTQEHKISESSFYKWQSEFRKAPKGFSCVSVKAPVTPGKIRCVLPNGLRLEWDESVALGSLLPIIKGLS